MSKRLLFIPILAITVLALAGHGNRADMPAVQAGVCSGASGKTRGLSFRGKIHVVNFWATWCPSCVRFLPSFAELERKYRGPDIEFLILTTENRRSIAEFEYNENYEFPFFVGSVPRQYLLDLGIEQIPAYFVIDTKGRIAWRGHPHNLSAVRLESLIKASR